MVRTVTATRYVAPLREGGSLPAIVEADDDGMYVVKFRGAGQGPKVLVAELICGELGRALGLPIPEIVFVELDAALGRNEPDGEIQQLVTASAGLNLGLDYLPGSLGFDPLDTPRVDPALAAAIVWFDALITNVDRTPRNTNMLWWHRNLWLIDHGAALYVHHTWDDYRGRALSRFPVIREHVLLAGTADLAAADARLAPQIDAELIDHVLALVPDAWLLGSAEFPTTAAFRSAYRAFLLDRLAPPRAFVEEAINARAQRI
ncbi:MAG TPA: aminotransferase class I and II [Roseiflexaceae bacterium]|nr:aminotransferase class I and II [Roseiflexaceae bacterium]HMP40451.1 aminotransferase class I and II [Roseiflexaceae bacterium]